MPYRGPVTNARARGRLYHSRTGIFRQLNDAIALVLHWKSASYDDEIDIVNCRREMVNDLLVDMRPMSVNF